MSGVVLVIGGSGKTGAPLISRLKQAGWTPRCASRSAQASPGVEAVTFDWFDTGGHAAALTGVDRAYLIAPVGSNAPIEVMQPFIEQAISLGVRRFVLLSSSSIEEGGPAMGEVHALLRRCAPEWAVLRPSWFMENFSMGHHAATIREEDSIYSATDDGRVPFVSVDDIAAVAFNALTNDRIMENDLLITGPETLSYDEVAAIIGSARRKSVRHVRLTGDQLAARFEGFGIQRDYAALLAGLDRLIAQGGEARTSSAVARNTGRPPLTFPEFAVRNASVWKQ